MLRCKPYAKIACIESLVDFVPSCQPGCRSRATLLQHIAGTTWLDDLADRRALFHWGTKLTARARMSN